MVVRDELIRQLNAVFYAREKADYIHWLVRNAKLEGYDQFKVGNWIEHRLGNERIDRPINSNVKGLPIWRDVDPNEKLRDHCNYMIASGWPMIGMRISPAQIRHKLGPEGDIQDKTLNEMREESPGLFRMWCAMRELYLAWVEEQKGRLDDSNLAS